MPSGRHGEILETEKILNKTDKDMYGASEMIRAGRLTNVMDLDTFLGWRAGQANKEGIFFSVFILPDSAKAIEAGDVVMAAAKLPHREATKVPLVVGDWSPVVFVDIDHAAIISLEGVAVDRDHVYVAPMDGRDVVVK